MLEKNLIRLMLVLLWTQKLIDDEGEKELLLEAGYIPISDRIRMAEEDCKILVGSNRELREHKPFVEVLE